MEIGNEVRQVVPVIAGTIADTRYNKGTKKLEHLVVWQDGEEEGSRWFSESELELVEKEVTK